MSKGLGRRELVISTGRFGKLTVKGLDTKGRIRCECDCGKKTTYQVSTLLDKGIGCCGCTFGGFGKRNALKVRYFSKLEVVSINKDNTVSCKCSCGKIEKVPPRKLFLKETTSCTSCKDNRTEGMRWVDYAVETHFRKDMLTAESRDEIKTTRQKACIFMRCDCGNLKSFEYKSLLKLRYGSCGCYRPKLLHPSPATQKVLDIKTFTYWTVDSWTGDDNRYVNCTCKCGNSGRIRSDSLLTGDATSCGCRARALCSARFKGNYKVDAVTRHPLSHIYKSIFRRCYSENNPDYKHYGGRGISVCKRWTSPPRDVTGFINFVEDMEGGYRSGLEIERLDVNGHYEPENCTWVCRRSQVNNLRENRILKGFGVNLTVSEWGYLLNFNCKMLDDRINKGKDSRRLEDILADTFRDRRHTLIYKGVECNASQVWEMEGYTLGQRNSRLSKYGDSLAALEAEGIEVTVVKPREKDYYTFEEGLGILRTKTRDSFEEHLMFKIEQQLKEKV